MTEAFIYTTSLEIVISILTGTFLCFLSYLLFKKGFSTKSDFDFEFGNLKLKMHSTPAAVFFAFFGAFIISLSIWQSAKMQQIFKMPDGTIQTVSITKGNETNNDFEKKIAEKFKTAFTLHGKKDLEGARLLYLEILNSRPVILDSINNLANIYLDENQIEYAASLSLTANIISPENETFIKTFEEIKEKQNPGQ